MYKVHYPHEEHRFADTNEFSRELGLAALLGGQPLLEQVLDGHPLAQEFSGDVLQAGRFFGAGLPSR